MRFIPNVFLKSSLQFLVENGEKELEEVGLTRRTEENTEKGVVRETREKFHGKISFRTLRVL